LSKGRHRFVSFSSKQVLESSSKFEDCGSAPARSHPHTCIHTVIHYGRILHRRQLALESNELMNMHWLVLINYAFHTSLLWDRPRRAE
jgi:hypothetical protein